MSNINAVSKDGKKISFGFDHAIGYFFDVYDDPTGEPTIQLASLFSGLTKEGLLKEINTRVSPSKINLLKDDIANVINEGDDFLPADEKFDKVLFIIALFYIEIIDALPVDIDLLPHLPGLHITNDHQIIENCIRRRLTIAIGTLEVDALRNAKTIIYGLYPTSFFGDLSQEQILLVNLRFVEAFLHSLWLVKDNSANCEMGFLENPFNSANSAISGNFLANLSTKASGRIEVTEFKPDEILRASELVATIGKFPDNPNQIHFLQKNSKRIDRVFQFLKVTRLATTTALKIPYYCTCFETLFSTSSTELSHKLSERIACFLAKSPDEKLEIYNQIKSAYDIRSKVIHGDQLSDSKIREMEQIAENCDNYLRMILNKILDSEELKEIFLQNSNQLEDYFIKLTLGFPL